MCAGEVEVDFLEGLELTFVGWTKSHKKLMKSLLHHLTWPGLQLSVDIIMAKPLFWHPASRKINDFLSFDPNTSRTIEEQRGMVVKKRVCERYIHGTVPIRTAFAGNPSALSSGYDQNGVYVLTLGVQNPPGPVQPCGAPVPILGAQGYQNTYSLRAQGTMPILRSLRSLRIPVKHLTVANVPPLSLVAEGIPQILVNGFLGQALTFIINEGITMIIETSTERHEAVRAGPTGSHHPLCFLFEDEPNSLTWNSSYSCIYEKTTMNC